MHSYFFITMKGELDTLARLATLLHEVPGHRKVTLVDQDEKLVVARLDVPGSLYDTLKTESGREISYAEMSHSYEALPGVGKALEIHQLEFRRKSGEDIVAQGKPWIPPRLRRDIRAVMKKLYPQFDFRDLRSILGLLWVNNETYVRISPPERVARVMWVYQQGKQHGGLYLDVETKENESGRKESRLMFSVGNPPQSGFLTQVSEIFQRLEIGVRRSYCLFIHTGIHPYFLGNFYVLTWDGHLVEKESDLFERVKKELYNTQILCSSSPAYTGFLMNRVMTGEEALLTNAFVAFCHTVLAHNQPDRYDAAVVEEAFHSEPELTLRLINAFKARLQPQGGRMPDPGEENLDPIKETIERYNTGHRSLDEVRRTVFFACLQLVRHTLKTNFWVPEKHALALRLDPAFLGELGPEFVADLPRARPFRITFFFTRHAVGYHIGFSDIARGGWRTVVCRSTDELVTNRAALFREVFVLAHTQHLKNKDIYEGGSKLTVVLDAVDLDSPGLITQRLYKAQYGIFHAFLDIFVTENGRAKDPRVVDYYGQDEPIELGPDENMHERMIEYIADQSARRGYILGIGVMSSKRVGINHREFGVTSRGVVKCAEVAMRHAGFDVDRDPFVVKFTGGPNGDVAGNSMRLLLERFPRAKIRAIVDGTAGLFDPEDVQPDALRSLLLERDLEHFDPEALHPAGFLLFRTGSRRAGLGERFRKLVRGPSGIEEQWVTTDEFHREMDDLIFSVRADLFLPCGGRPETIDGNNWPRLFQGDGSPTVSVIVEGANSFLAPEARREIQKRGVVILRDASANKCGVISSSYEIIANLLMTDRQFLLHKKVYVEDVLKILERRAKEEAELIFNRHGEAGGRMSYTEISDAISLEINDHYSMLFAFFQDRPELLQRGPFERVILEHMPDVVRSAAKWRSAVKRLPIKIRCAILAREIATRIVYRGGWEMDLEARLGAFLKKNVPPRSLDQRGSGELRVPSGECSGH
ncbi:MAG: NAD-glutamate dehydrogenase [Deltaproteobacteria bacterium]|nr:NAD-glutamate dehydrogenase [Deltaproteobacteria bacterium]